MNCKKLASSVCLLSLIYFNTVTAQESDFLWPQFRGVSGQGSTTDDGPTEWSEEKGIVWKTELPGAGTSSPTIVGSKIYLTAYTGFNVPGEQGEMDNLKLHLICLDADSGKQLWSKEIQPNLPEQESIRDGHGYASSSLAADESGLYAFFGKTGVIAFDFDGDQRWQTNVGTTLHGWGSAASPVLYEELVIVNASVESASLVALNKTTGEQVWKLNEVNESWNTPILHKNSQGSTELLLAKAQKVLSIDPNTGKENWNCNTDIGWYMVPSLLADRDLVFAIGGRSGIAALAVRSGGSGDVTESKRLWTGQKGSNVSSPVFHDGHLYFANDSQCIAYCLNAETGEVVYEKRLSGVDQVYASATLADGRIYYLGRNGTTCVVAAKPEFELLATNKLDRGVFNASPVVVKNRLYLRSDKHLYCIGD